MRNGLSIVEVIVALMLVTIALLGMAGSTAFSLRQINDAAGRRAALHVGQSRLGTLTTLGCLRASSGSATANAMSERWTVQGTAGFARVTDTITWSSPRGPRRLALESAFPC